MWQFKNNERLSEWRKFRRALNTSNTILDDIRKFWEHAPVGPNVYDQSNPKEWPTPWDLVLEDSYDDFARALGMTMTFLLIDGVDSNRIALNVYIDREQSAFYHLPIIDNQIVLNYNWGSLEQKDSISSTAELQYSYRYNDFRLG